jgi:hypothetical protein
MWMFIYMLLSSFQELVTLPLQSLRDGIFLPCNRSKNQGGTNAAPAGVSNLVKLF